MAITLNKQAIRCEEIAIANGKITPSSSARPLLYDISRSWRDLCDATVFRNDSSGSWSEREIQAAEVMIATMTYLQRIGCKNIERLLLDIIEYHSRNIE